LVKQKLEAVAVAVVLISYRNYKLQNSVQSECLYTKIYLQMLLLWNWHYKTTKTFTLLLMISRSGQL